jgi:curved DNA-binding protein CbpA
MLEEYFKILELDKTASQEEIKRAYRFLAKKYHPDVSSEHDAGKKFIQITEAYEILTNQKVLETLKIMAENEEERKRSYEYFKMRAKEVARQAAEIKYERLKKEHEAFQQSGMYDLFLLINYIGHFLLIFVTIFLLGFPVYIVVKTGFYGLFFFLIAGITLSIHILSRRKTYFKLGSFFYTFKDIKSAFIEELGKGTEKCSYCLNHKADSYPYKIDLLKINDIQLSLKGMLWHEARYNRTYKKLSLPRSKKAFQIHTSTTLIKAISILLALIFLPFSSLMWRFVGGIAFGGLVTALVLSFSHTRSKVSYLYTGSFFIRLGFWLLILIMLCRWNNFPDIQPTDSLVIGVISLLFFQDVLIDLVGKILFRKSNLEKPIIKQPLEIQKLINEGYQDYLEIPVWSTIYPLIKWIF